MKIHEVDATAIVSRPNSMDIRAIYGLPSREDLHWVRQVSSRMLVILYHMQTCVIGKATTRQILKSLDSFIAQHKHHYGVKEIKHRIIIFCAPVKLKDREFFKEDVLRHLNGESVPKQVWTVPPTFSIGSLPTHPKIPAE